MEFILQKKKKTFIGHLAIYFEENEKSRYFSDPCQANYMDVTLEMLLNHFGISLTEDFCHRLRQPHMLFGRIYGNNQINDCKIDVKHLEPFFFPPTILYLKSELDLYSVCIKPFYNECLFAFIIRSHAERLHFSALGSALRP